MIEPFNGLTPAEAERLFLLAEECGEVIQAVCKVLRHGYHCVNPHEPEAGTYREMLERHMAHIKVAEHMMTRAGDIRNEVMVGHTIVGLIKIQQWLHEQPSTGTRT